MMQQIAWKTGTYYRSHSLADAPMGKPIREVLSTKINATRPVPNDRVILRKGVTPYELSKIRPDKIFRERGGVLDGFRLG